MTQQRYLWTIAGVLMAGLLLSIAILIANAAIQADNTPQTPYDGLPRHLTGDDAPVLGDVTAPITLVVFVDFACPHCADYEATLREFITTYVRPGKARLEMRVLGGLDPSGSPLAARAALCATEQNAFWEMQDALMRLQKAHGRSAFSIDRIREAAEWLRLDSGDLIACVNNPGSYDETLQTNVEMALTLDVSTLPAILIRRGSNYPEWPELNGVRLTGQIPLETLGTIVEAVYAATD